MLTNRGNTDVSVKELPEFFYKYQAGTEPQLDSLQRRKIWYATPPSLNDPQDCHLEIGIEKAVQWHEAIIPNMWRTPAGRIVGNSGAICKKWSAEQEAQLRARFNAEVANLKALIAQTGIFCLSASPFIDKMWSDFANGAKGFCIEYPSGPFFDPNHRQDSANPVDYTEEYPDVDYGVLVREPFPVRMQKLFGYKSKTYALEQEWRCIVPKGGVEEDSPSISAIIFGLRAEDALVQRAIDMFSTDVEPPAFRRIRRRHQSYELEAVSI